MAASARSAREHYIRDFVGVEVWLNGNDVIADHINGPLPEVGRGPPILFGYASGSAPALPSGKEDLFAPLLTVPLRLSSDHWLFPRKSERQGRASSFRFEFWFLYSGLVFLHSTQPPSGIPLGRAGAASSFFSCFLREGLRRRSGHGLCR